ncbi:MAG: hypothetical protein WC004_03745 [Candidatus Absconditabacterales bacterium]
MNPKLKLTLVLGIPVIGVALWVFSLLRLLGPEDVATDITGGQSGDVVTDIVLPASSGTTVVTTGLSQTGFVKPTVAKSIKVAMPIWLYNEPGRRPIINKLAQQSIKLQIVTNPWSKKYDEFVAELFTGGATGVDIVLTDTTHLESLGQYAGSFGFSQDISSLFHYVFSSYLKNIDYTFVPFGIDPLVTYAKTPLIDNPQSIDRDTIVNNSITDIDLKRIQFQIPILFGVSSLDMSLLKGKKEVYEGYRDILASVVYQSSNRTELIDLIKQYSSDTLEIKIWDFAKYKRLLEKLKERSEKCDVYPKMCFIYYKLTNFAFGYLSDVEIINQYMGQTDYTVYNFPVSSNVYPVKLWGRVVNKANYDKLVKVDADGVSLAGVFFQEYIAQATNGNHYLRPTLFSAFNAVLTTQETDLNRRYVSQYKNKWQTNPILLKTDEQLEQFVALLKGDYDLEVFLAGLIR